jgi:hypothetical protein
MSFPANRSIIVGNHAFFFRDGDAFTVPSSGTAARAAKPGAADAGWIDFGIISSLGVTPSKDAKEVYAPTPGQLRLYDVIETKRKLDIKFDTEEMSSLAFEILFGTLPLTGSSTQYNPLEGVTKKGWLKIQQYGQDDALINTLDVYVHLHVTGEVKFDDNIVKAPFEANVLHSTLNTGTL